ARKYAVHVDRGLAHFYAYLFDLRGLEVVLFHEVEHRGDETLDRRRRRPQAQRDLLEFPALAQLVGRRGGRAAVRIRVVEAAVFMREEFDGGEDILLREQ